MEKKEDKTITKNKIKTIADYLAKYRKTNKLEDLIRPKSLNMYVNSIFYGEFNSYSKNKGV